MKTYKTTCYKTGAVLMTLGHKFLGVRPYRDKSFELEFDYADTLNQDVMDFSNGDLRIDPKALYDNQGMIHSRVKEFRLN